MTTTKTAKDVLAERMRLLKQFEDRTNQLEVKAQEAVAARVKQAEEKEKAIEREKARHEAAMAALDEEYAMAEKHQTRRLEATKEDIKKVAEQYQKDLQKIDNYLSNHPVLVETPPPKETKKEKPPINIDTITQHLHADNTLHGQSLTPELIASSLMELMKKLNQDACEDTTTDEGMEQKNGDAGAAKRAASPLAERPAKEQKKEDDEFKDPL